MHVNISICLFNAYTHILIHKYQYIYIDIYINIYLYML